MNLLKSKCINCFFHQNNKCIMQGNQLFSWFCGGKIQKIKGIENTLDYVNIIYGKKHNLRTLAVSILSLLIALSVLFIKVLELYKSP